MICEIDGQEVAREAVSYRGLGFGEDVPLETSPYALRYHRPELLVILARPYQRWLREMKEDFQLTGDDSGAEYLRRFGYPSLEELVQHQSEFCKAIKTFLYLDLLDASLGAPNDERLKWVINGIDELGFAGGSLVLRGRAYRCRGDYVGKDMP